MSGIGYITEETTSAKRRYGKQQPPHGWPELQGLQAGSAGTTTRRDLTARFRSMRICATSKKRNPFLYPGPSMPLNANGLCLEGTVYESRTEGDHLTMLPDGEPVRPVTNVFPT